MIQFNHEAESRVNAIQHTALDKSGKRYYGIETVGEGVLAADGGHVLGRKEDYDQGNVDKPPLEEKLFMNEEFEHLCKSLESIGDLTVQKKLWRQNLSSRVSHARCLYTLMFS